MSIPLWRPTRGVTLPTSKSRRMNCWSIAHASTGSCQCSTSCSARLRSTHRRARVASGYSGHTRHLNVTLWRRLHSTSDAPTPYPVNPSHNSDQRLTTDGHAKDEPFTHGALNRARRFRADYACPGLARMPRSGIRDGFKSRYRLMVAGRFCHL